MLLTSGAAAAIDDITLPAYALIADDPTALLAAAHDVADFELQLMGAGSGRLQLDGGMASGGATGGGGSHSGRGAGSGGGGTSSGGGAAVGRGGGGGGAAASSRGAVVRGGRGGSGGLTMLGAAPLTLAEVRPAGWFGGVFCGLAESCLLNQHSSFAHQSTNCHNQRCRQQAAARAVSSRRATPHPLPSFLAAGAAGGPLDYVMGPGHDYEDTFEHELLFLPDTDPQNTAAAGTRAGAGSSAAGAAADAGGAGGVAAEGAAFADGTPGFPYGAAGLFELQAPVWGEAAAARHSRGTRSTSAVTIEVVQQMEDGRIAVGMVEEEVHQEVFEEMEWEGGGEEAAGGRALLEGEGEEEGTEDRGSPPPPTGGLLSPSAPHRRLPQLPLAQLGAGRRLGFGAADAEMGEEAAAGGVVRRTLDFAAAGNGAREVSEDEHEQDEEAAEEGGAAAAQPPQVQRARRPGARPRRRLAAVAVDVDTKVSTEAVRADASDWSNDWQECAEGCPAV